MTKLVTLTAAERRMATDGNIVWGRGHAKAGKPIGVREMLRRKRLMDQWRKYK